MTRRHARLLLVLLVAPALAGCWHEDEGDPPQPPTGETPATPTGPVAQLTFGGTVVDARTREPLAEATVRLDLAQTRPCRREGILWNAYDLPVGADGRFGPRTLPTPRSDDVAFFLHATAPGYTENVTFVGPEEARAGVRNLTVLLHPEAALEGRAPPGTLVALEAPGFPRVAVSGAEGAFRIPGARVVEASFAASTEPPTAGRATPPATLDLAHGGGATWRLEGVARDERGAAVQVDVVAWRAGALASVARAGPTGVFVLPLAPEPQDLLLQARTSEGHLGGSLRVVVDGPPATRQSLLVTPLC